MLMALPYPSAHDPCSGQPRLPHVPLIWGYMSLGPVDPYPIISTKFYSFLQVRFKYHFLYEACPDLSCSWMGTFFTHRTLYFFCSLQRTMFDRVERSKSISRLPHLRELNNSSGPMGLSIWKWQRKDLFELQAWIPILRIKMRNLTELPNRWNIKGFKVLCL